MSESNITGATGNSVRQPASYDASHAYASRLAVREAGHRYIEKLGWSVFLMRHSSDGVTRALRMCEYCRSTPHDKNTCACGTYGCHGFYAATNDHDEFERLWHARTESNALAVRTGNASGIFIVDFDMKHDAPAAHDAWGEATGLDWTFPKTLRQHTKSGGFHLVYRLPTPDTMITSRNAVTLRGVDIKAEGGLFIVDPTPGYQWDARILPAVAPHHIVSWAMTAPLYRHMTQSHHMNSRLSSYLRGRSGGTSPSGISLIDAASSGCPVGERDWFINAVCFALRVADTPRDDAEKIMHEEWSRLEQPEGDEFRWEWCLYKMERIWRDVTPDRTIVSGTRWVHAAITSCSPFGEHDVIRIGRKTIARRPTP